MMNMIEAGQIKRANDAKSGIARHHRRLVEALALLNKIKSSECCEDNTPFSCGDYFPDGEFYLEKAIFVIEQALEVLLSSGAEITKSHIESVEDCWEFWDQQDNGVCDACK